MDFKIHFLSAEIHYRASLNIFIILKIWLKTFQLLKELRALMSNAVYNK